MTGFESSGNAQLQGLGATPPPGQPVRHKGVTTFREAHAQADTDADPGSIHHTIGYGPNEAAPGTVVQELKKQTTDLIGEVKLWILDTPPPHFLECAGQSLNTTDYPDLFAKIGYRWGGAGTTFKLPDARTRLLMGANGDVGASDGVADPATRNGYQNHPHTHHVDITTSSGATISGNTNSGGNHSHQIVDDTNSGGSHSHDVTSSTHSHGSTGGPSGIGSNYTTGGSGSAAGPSHTHTVGSDTHAHTTFTGGSHTHAINVFTYTDTGHSHGVSVGLPAHNHSGNTDTNTSAQHPYLKIMVIIRYESGIEFV